MVKHPSYGQPGWDLWLSARQAVEDLPVEWPACDERCAGLAHDPDVCVLLADLEIERTDGRGGDWWDYGRRVEIERAPEWQAVQAATPQTSTDARLSRFTRLRRLATTDQYWSVVLNPGTAIFEELWEILDGPFVRGLLVSVKFGPSGIRAGLAGKLIVQDHPPARDPGVTERRIAEVAPALERGLPLESAVCCQGGVS